MAEDIETLQVINLDISWGSWVALHIILFLP